MRRLTAAVVVAAMATSLPSLAVALDAGTSAAGLVAPKRGGAADYQLQCDTCLKPITSGAGYKNAAGKGKKAPAQKQQPGSTNSK